MEFFKPCLMGHTSRSMKDSSAEYDLMNFWVNLIKRLQRRGILINMLPRDCSYDILMTNVAAFCPCTKNFG